MNKGKISFGKISTNFDQNAEKIEASGGFGTFGPPKAIEVLEDDNKEQEQIKEVMGITSFGKKAKTFDIKEMIEQVKATAREITKNVEPEQDESEDDDDDDDEFIGPPIPVNLGESTSKESQKTETNEVSDSEEEEEEEEEEEVNKLFIPCSCEAMMTHGNKAVTAISVDPSGARLASGSVDYDVNMSEEEKFFNQTITYGAALTIVSTLAVVPIFLIYVNYLSKYDMPNFLMWVMEDPYLRHEIGISGHCLERPLRLDPKKMKNYSYRSRRSTSFDTNPWISQKPAVICRNCKSMIEHNVVNSIEELLD